ncbi:hypothetical protein CB1_000309009 [Camelus ferus]|nr:hypothetical protein CB1_000309009 [Camelus ferus]
MPRPGPTPPPRKTSGLTHSPQLAGSGTSRTSIIPPLLDPRAAQAVGAATCGALALRRYEKSSGTKISAVLSVNETKQERPTGEQACPLESRPRPCSQASLSGTSTEEKPPLEEPTFQSCLLPTRTLTPGQDLLSGHSWLCQPLAPNWPLTSASEGFTAGSQQRPGRRKRQQDLHNCDAKKKRARLHCLFSLYSRDPLGSLSTAHKSSHTECAHRRYRKAKENQI